MGHVDHYCQLFKTEIDAYPFIWRGIQFKGRLSFNPILFLINKAKFLKWGSDYMSHTDMAKLLMFDEDEKNQFITKYFFTDLSIKLLN